MALLVLVLASLAAFGFVGPAVGTERITAYDVTATIRSDDTVEVREIIDWDFGGSSRRGIFRDIPSDGGQPEEIEVSAPEAPDEFTVSEIGFGTNVRIGDPDTKIRGRYRYEVSYVLPRTVVDDRFALDAIGSKFDVPIEEARVTVVGAELADLGCFAGLSGSREPGSCTFTADGDATFRTQLADLGVGEGVTVEGDVVADRPTDVPPPPAFVDRDGGARLRWAGLVGGIAALVALAMFVTCRQLGRNQVAGGGATEAAFAGPGSSPFGVTPHAAPDRAPPPTPATRMVADTKMAELAGIEFVPPTGVEPWQAAVALREEIDDRTIGTWFASLAAHDVVTLKASGSGTSTGSGSGSGVVLAPGPRAGEADPVTASILNRALGGRSKIDLGRYDPAFSAAWKRAGDAISRWVQSEGIFRRRPPGVRKLKLNVGLLSVAFLFGYPIVTAVTGTSGLGGLRSPVTAILLALLVPVIGGWIAYGRLTRSLSARGSGIALRSESFRRFLHESEAQHVEWAWDNGLLREYSAWAVALDEADAWNQALAGSAVPPAEITATTGIMAPVLYSSSFRTAHTAPSSSGSGGGGGFSGGGSVGGGGGGGGGGSW